MFELLAGRCNEAPLVMLNHPAGVDDFMHKW